MPLDEHAAKKVLAEINRDELAQLGCDLTNIPSPTGHALLTQEPNASKDRIRDVLSGNLCRCTGYVNIVDAVYEARAAYLPAADQGA